LAISALSQRSHSQMSVYSAFDNTGPLPMDICPSPSLALPLSTLQFSSPLITVAPQAYVLQTQFGNQVLIPQYQPMVLCSSPVQQLHCASPVPSLISQPPSPVQQPISTVHQTFFQSPSPQPCFSISQPVVSENCGPASRSHSVESVPTFQRLFAFDEIQEDLLKKWSVQNLRHELSLAMNRALNRFDLNYDIHFVRSPDKKEKKVTIEWRVESEILVLVQHLVERKGFEALLTCELARIDNFNTYLSRGKQLTIINEGWAVLNALKDTLVSRNRRLDTLLSTPLENRFDEEVYETLFKVSEDAQGNALRGKTVLGVRFKLLQEFFIMTEFINAVKQRFGTFRRSTMIVSSKKGTQKKGWSLYIDVATEISNEDCQQLAKQFGLPTKRVFVAQERGK
jgi:hypothetical protein